MKTFKLISLQIVEGADLKDIELQDGLIINKEDDLSSWLIEAYISKSYLDYFKSGDEMIVQVVISKGKRSCNVSNESALRKRV